MAPRTDVGKGFCILYALFGIPLGILALANIGKWCQHGLNLIENSTLDTIAKVRGQPIDRKDNYHSEPSFYTIVVVVIVVMFVNVGVASFSNDLNTLDSLYFIFISYTTVGFGDYHVETAKSLPMGLVCANILLGLAIMTMLVSVLADILRNLHYYGRKVTNIYEIPLRIGGAKVQLGDFTTDVLKLAGVEQSKIDEIVNNFDQIVNSVAPNPTVEATVEEDDDLGDWFMDIESRRPSRIF